MPAPHQISLSETYLKKAYTPKNQTMFVTRLLAAAAAASAAGAASACAGRLDNPADPAALGGEPDGERGARVELGRATKSQDDARQRRAILGPVRELG